MIEKSLDVSDNIYSQGRAWLRLCLLHQDKRVGRLWRRSPWSQPHICCRPSPGRVTFNTEWWQWWGARLSWYLGASILTITSPLLTILFSNMSFRRQKNLIAGDGKRRARPGCGLWRGRRSQHDPWQGWNQSISSVFADSNQSKFDQGWSQHSIFVKDAFFVTPCDSLAVLADNLEHIPWFKVSMIMFLFCHLNSLLLGRQM